MRGLQSREFRKFWIKTSPFSTNCIDYPDELVYNCYHSFLITAKALLLSYKVGSEVVIPLYYTYRHLEKDIPEKARPLLRYAHFNFILSRLLYYWVCACILYELFGIIKSFYISDFSQKETCKLRGDTFYRRNKLNLLLLVFVHLFFKRLFKPFYSWFKKEEFFDVEDECLGEVRIVNADGVFSKVNNIIRGEGRSSTFRGGRFDDFRDFIWFSFSKLLSGGEFKEYVKEGVGEDIEVFFGFGEEDCEGVFNLSFGFSEFMFKFLDEARKGANFRVIRVGFKEVGVSEGKESKDFSVFLIVFRGGVSGDEFKEPMDYFGVKDEGWDRIFNEEPVEGDVEPTRGFHDDDGVFEGIKDVKEVGEALRGHGEFSGVESFRFTIKDAEVEVILRDVNAYEVFEVLHFATSFLRIFLRNLSLTPSSRLAGALEAQSTHRVLRDRVTYSPGGLKAYEKWSPCPSLIYKLLYYCTGQNALNKT